MIFFWGFSFIIVDIALEFVPSLSIALYRLILASISIILINLFLNRKEDQKEINGSRLNDRRIHLKYWILIILASITGVSGYLLIIYTAVDIIGPSIPSFTDCLIAPIFIIIISLVIFREKLNKKMILGFTIASFGSFLLITGGNIGTLIPKNPNFFGYIFALLSPISWSIYTLSIKSLKKLKATRTDLRNLSYISYFGCLELFILVLIAGQIQIFVGNILNLIVFLCALYLALGAFVIGYYIWNISVKRLKSSKVASFLYIQPFLTLFFSILFDRADLITMWNVFGGIIVLGAIFIINYKE
jgi:drug/metabolite transporter (DMT)-like permease